MGNTGTTHVKKPRHPFNFNSGAGWIECAWQGCLALIIMAQFLNGINSMWFFLPGFMLTSVLGNLAFYMYNMFYLGPRYDKVKAKFRVMVRKCDKTPQDDENCELTYNQIISNDLKFHNDERHFKLGFLFTLFLLVSYGIFLIMNGQHTFQPLPIVFNHDDIMAYVWVKIFQMAVMGIAAMIITLCADTHSCFMFTQLTSINRKQKEWRMKLEQSFAKDGSPILPSDFPTEKEHYTKDGKSIMLDS